MLNLENVTDIANHTINLSIFWNRYVSNVHRQIYSKNGKRFHTYCKHILHICKTVSQQRIENMK